MVNPINCNKPKRNTESKEVETKLAMFGQHNRDKERKKKS